MKSWPTIYGRLSRSISGGIEAVGLQQRVTMPYIASRADCQSGSEWFQKGSWM